MEALFRIHSFSLGLQGTMISAPAQTLTVVRSTPTTWSYSVKVINRARKSDWTVQKLRVNQQFESLEGLKRQVSDSLKEAVEDPICIIGYIEAGHGTRGKQRWLTTDEDLMGMYGHYSSRGQILLWTYSPQNTATSSASVTTSKKRPHFKEGRPSPECSATKAPRTTKFELHQ